MKGLLYKDWCTLTARYRKNFILLFVLYVGMAVWLDMSFMLYALVFVLPLYVQSAVSFDEYSHWDAYARTLPVQPAAQVGSKYLLGGCAVLAGCLIAFLCFFVSPSGTKPAPQEALLGILTAAATATFYFSLSMPLSYKFGCDRARTAVMLAILALVGGLFAAVTLLSDAQKAELERFLGLRGAAGAPDLLLSNGEAVAGQEVLYGNLTAAMQGGRVQWVLLGLALGSAALFFLSWAVSTAIYRKKEY